MTGSESHRAVIDAALARLPPRCRRGPHDAPLTPLELAELDDEDVLAGSSMSVPAPQLTPAAAADRRSAPLAACQGPDLPKHNDRVEESTMTSAKQQVHTACWYTYRLAWPC